MKLLATVIYLGKNRLAAWVEDSSHAKRRIKVSWSRMVSSNVPPHNLLEILQKETEIQQGEDVRAQKGRKLP
jgi:hypothetical protein